MNKIWLIIQREYVTRVRKRLFLITTLLAPVGIALMTTLPILFSNMDSGIKNIYVCDESANGVVFKNLKSTESLHFQDSPLPYDELKKQLNDSSFNSILHVPSTFSKTNPAGVEFYTLSQPGLSLESDISQMLSDIFRTEELKKMNLTEGQIDSLDTNISISTVISNGSSLKESNTAVAAGLGYVMGFLIYIVLLIYGTQVMRGVMEEKMNRIVEVMISSVKPFQLMLGKIIGIALVGLTQFAIWILLSIIIFQGLSAFVGEKINPETIQQTQTMNQFSNPEAQQQFASLAGQLNDISNLPIALILITFPIFFFGGYMLYSSLFAAIGSAAGEEGDQSLTFIVTIPIIISIMLMFTVLNDPNSQMAVIASLIPFTAPVVMSARIPFDPPLWQVLLSILFLILGFLGTTWFAGKIYRIGILRYGKKASLKEMMKWLRYKD